MQYVMKDRSEAFLANGLAFVRNDKLYLVGIGMGNEKNRTVEAEQICQSADLLIGARRMLQSVKTEGKAVFESYKPDEIAAYLAEHPQYETAAVLLSGDIGFYSGAKKLYDAIERTEGLEQMEIYPVSGISSVVYFLRKTRRFLGGCPSFEPAWQKTESDRCSQIS